MRKTAIYIRVSVLKEEALSPEMQLSKCESYCRMMGEEYKVFQDLDFSGRDTKRPAFQAMRREIEAGAIGKVVVYRLDRLSRSLKDLVLFIDLLRERGVELVSLTERFDTSSPMGRAMLNIMGVFAQMEREVIAQRIKDAKALQMRNGVKLGMPPFGYRLKVGTHGEWEICREEAKIVREVFRMYATGRWSYRSIARYLNGRVKRRRERKPGQSTWGRGEYSKQGWQPWTVRCILTNPTYAGIVREDVDVEPKNFKPLISPDLFRRCQEIRNRRSPYHSSYCHSTTRDYPLKGKIFCSCGFKMYGTRDKRLPKGLYYWCRNALKGRGHCRFAPADMVMDEILSYLMSCRISEDLLKRARERLLRREGMDEAERERMIKNLQLSYQRLQEQYIDGAISKRFMRRKAREIEEKLRSLQPEGSSYVKAVLLEELPRIIRRLKEGGGERDREYLEKLIDLFVRKVVWDKDHVERIEIYPELRDLFPHPYRPREEVSAEELAKLAGVSINSIYWWNRKGVLPHSRVLKRGKMFLKEESLERIGRIRGMLGEGYRLWQIREYLEKGRLLLSLRQIARRLGVSYGMISYRLPLLIKPHIRRNGASYWDFEEAEEALKGDLRPYRFLGRDLRRWKVESPGEGCDKPILLPRMRPWALISALKGFDKEGFLKGKPSLATAYEMERELGVGEGTLRYHVRRLLRPKVVMGRRKLYSRDEVAKLLIKLKRMGMSG